MLVMVRILATNSQIILPGKVSLSIHEVSCSPDVEAMGKLTVVMADPRFLVDTGKFILLD